MKRFHSMFTRNTHLPGVLFLWAAWIAGCNDAAEPRAFDSNSNWLRSCEADVDCGDEFACVGRRCMATCSAGSECTGQANLCRSLVESNSCLAPTTQEGQCFASCSGDAECSALAPELSCVDGACIAQLETCSADDDTSDDDADDDASDDDADDSGSDDDASDDDASDDDADDSGSDDDASDDDADDSASDDDADDDDADDDASDDDASDDDASDDDASDDDASDDDARGDSGVPSNGSLDGGNGPLVDAGGSLDTADGGVVRSYVAGITNGIGCCDFYGVTVANFVDDYCVTVNLRQEVGLPIVIESATGVRPAAACAEVNVLPVSDALDASGVTGSAEQIVVDDQFRLKFDFSVVFDQPNEFDLPARVDVQHDGLLPNWEWSPAWE